MTASSPENNYIEDKFNNFKIDHRKHCVYDSCFDSQMSNVLRMQMSVFEINTLKIGQFNIAIALFITFDDDEMCRSY